MTNAWVAEGGKDAAHRRLLRDYITQAASTGIRAGLELERITLGAVTFQPTPPAIFVWIPPRSGKHKLPRSVVVFEGGVFSDVRDRLADLIAFRRSQGATDRDKLFAYPDGAMPDFGKGLKSALRAAGCLIDPDTGKARVGYSFRHYFATVQIERGLSVLQLAQWMGTGGDMIEKHYNRYLTEHNAHLVNGYDATIIADRKDRAALQQIGITMPEGA
jgi:integrase